MVNYCYFFNIYLLVNVDSWWWRFRWSEGYRTILFVHFDEPTSCLSENWKWVCSFTQVRNFEHVNISDSKKYNSENMWSGSSWTADLFNIWTGNAEFVCVMLVNVLVIITFSCKQNYFVLLQRRRGRRSESKEKEWEQRGEGTNKFYPQRVKSWSHRRCHFCFLLVTSLELNVANVKMLKLWPGSGLWLLAWRFWLGLKKCRGSWWNLPLR